MHYVAADATLVPPRHRDGFTETLLLLPRCYQLNDHAQLYTHVLGEGALRGAPPPLAWPTIANFNQLMKVSPDVFGVWSSAMRRAPVRAHPLTLPLTLTLTLTLTLNPNPNP